MSVSWAPVPVVLVGIVALLSFASLAVWRRREPNGELALRVRSWWVIVFVGATCLLLGRFPIIVFLGMVSFLALKEYLSVIPTRRADRRVLLLLYLSIPVQYGLIYAGSYNLVASFVPVYVFLILPTAMVLAGETKHFLSAVSTLFWGLMLTVFCLAHLALVFVMPENGDGAALLLYLVLMTQVGDVAQYLWGKRCGKHLVLPKVSPSKTVEGLVGGVVTITLLSGLLGPYLTPMSWPLALASGFLIALAGFFGDVTVSALKRDLGIKDSSSFIPGHGGILDRVDSLTYAAPLFFHLVQVFYGFP